jgi:hypothetical protein
MSIARKEEPHERRIDVLVPKPAEEALGGRLRMQLGEIRLAEDLGYDSVWLTEHISPRMATRLRC